VQTAALQGNEPVVSYLMSKGANIAARSNHGSSALDFAESFGRTAVVNVLKPAVLRLLDRSARAAPS
jgi:ankyrin repeat protein